MTPIEKAKELVDKYSIITKWKMGAEKDYVLKKAKECALIAVDEIISSREDDVAFNDVTSYTGSEYYTPHPMYLTYWKQVKQEIEKL